MVWARARIYSRWAATGGSEDQLTEMLAWLVSVVPAVGERLTSLAIPGWDAIGLPIPATQNVITAGRLDLVIETENKRVVIQSKLASIYHDSQLGRYAEWLAEQPDDKRLALLTLTEHPGRVEGSGDRAG
jgi:PD-(D/E)XK nuclease superfamily